MTDEQLAALHPFEVMYVNESGAREIFAQRYFEIYNESICLVCPGVLMEKHQRFKNDFRTQKIVEMENQTYTIPKGEIVDTYNSLIPPQGHYDASNLTDEIAEQLIRNGAGLHLIVRKDGKPIDLSKKEAKEKKAKK